MVPHVRSAFVAEAAESKPLPFHINSALQTNGHQEGHQSIPIVLGEDLAADGDWSGARFAWFPLRLQHPVSTSLVLLPFGFVAV